VTDMLCTEKSDTEKIPEHGKLNSVVHM